MEKQNVYKDILRNNVLFENKFIFKIQTKCHSSSRPVWKLLLQTLLYIKCNVQNDTHSMVCTDLVPIYAKARALDLFVI